MASVLASVCLLCCRLFFAFFLQRVFRALNCGRCVVARNSLCCAVLICCCDRCFAEFVCVLPSGCLKPDAPCLTLVLSAISLSFSFSLSLVCASCCRGGPLADDDGLDAVLAGKKAGGRGGNSNVNACIKVEPYEKFPTAWFVEAGGWWQFCLLGRGTGTSYSCI